LERDAKVGTAIFYHFGLTNDFDAGTDSCIIGDHPGTSANGADIMIFNSSAACRDLCKHSAPDSCQGMSFFN
jgi:hypothetical protein